MEALSSNFKLIADDFAKQAVKISITLQLEDPVQQENFC